MNVWVYFLNKALFSIIHFIKIKAKENKVLISIQSYNKHFS